MDIERFAVLLQFRLLVADGRGKQPHRVMAGTHALQMTEVFRILRDEFFLLDHCFAHGLERALDVAEIRVRRAAKGFP